MSVNLIQNPNGLAATFDLGHDLINPYGKIIIPRGDVIEDCVPLAKNILGQHKAFKRVDLTHDVTKGTVLTVNLITIGGQSPQGFWNEGRRGLVQHWINDFFTQKNEPIIHLRALQQNYEAQDRFDIGDADNHVMEFYTVSKDVLSTLARPHGGDFEFIEMDPYDTDATGKDPVVSTVSVFGACAGCGSFDKTYGQASELINQRLSSTNPYYSHSIKESPAHKGGMVFKRAP